MVRGRIDEDRLRNVLTQAADEGYRIAFAHASRGRGASRERLNAPDLDGAIELTHRYCLAKALELVPREAAEDAEPPLYWSIQEILEWLLFASGEGSRARGTPPITWAPWETWNRWTTDGIVESRLELLRCELSALGLELVPGSGLEDQP